MIGKQGSPSFLKKRSKKLSSISVGGKLASEGREAIIYWLRRALPGNESYRIKFFCFFFFKKRSASFLPPLPSVRPERVNIERG